MFNIAGLKTSEQLKKTWEEKLKLNVKYKIGSKQRAMELVQTEMIIPLKEDEENSLVEGMNGEDDDTQRNDRCELWSS